MKKTKVTHLIYVMQFFLFFSFSDCLFSQDFRIAPSPKLNINGSLDSLIISNMEAVNADSIEHTMLQLQNMGTRFMLAPNRKQVAEWIQEKFESVGCQNTAIDSFQTHTVTTIANQLYDTITWQYNVMATIPGQIDPDKKILIGGHYDCFTSADPMNIAPGADDNGSSVAAVIELARVINNSDYEPAKTIRFIAFAAEELMNYSDESGARDHAEKCAQNEEDIVLLINNDMIANSPLDDWELDLLIHDTEYWTTLITQDLAQQYTSLSTYVIDQGNFGADDLAFWQVGYQTMYFMEHVFCPFYHTEEDVVSNCNIDYCREVTSLNMALVLSVSEVPGLVENYFLNSLGDGQSLQATWGLMGEDNIEGYELHFGTDPSALLETYTTEDTSFIFSGLDPETMYYLSVCAINKSGNMSFPVIRYARPAPVTMDQGILIIAGSQGGLLDPSQEEIELFYDSLCYNFVYENFDASQVDEIRLDDIGKYSSVIWHQEDPDWGAASISQNLNVLRNYLFLGGNVMFTGFRPGKLFGAEGYPAYFREGSFMYDCLKISYCNNEAAKLFAGAIPENFNLPSVYVDSVKIPAFNFHLPWVEIFKVADEGEVIYRYDTKFDTTTQGSYFNEAVAIAPSGNNKQTVTLGFPLFYMDIDQSRQLVYEVMANMFHEEYLQVPDLPLANRIEVFPNPAKDNIRFRMNQNTLLRPEISILDVSGRLVQKMIPEISGFEYYEAELNLTLIPSGVYFYRIIIDDKVESGKIIVSK